MDKFYADYYANCGEKMKFLVGGVRILIHPHIRFIFLGRLIESQRIPKFLRKICRFLMYKISVKTGLEIDFSSGTIGKGLQLIHPFAITVNPDAVLGNNVVLFKGCTIGSIRSGKRKGVPHIGSRVVLGCNSFVCGGISIGNDVFIAANAFVSFDVPSYSVVIGNPGVIIKKSSNKRLYKRGNINENWNYLSVGNST